jgi:hypothetical protein
MAGVTLLGIATLATPTAARATDLETFDRLIAKSARKFGDARSRATCVCHDGSGLDDVAGALERNVSSLIQGGQGVFVACVVPTFEPDGSLRDQTNCFTFETLPR